VKLPVFITSCSRRVCRKLGQDVTQIYVTQFVKCYVPSTALDPSFSSLLTEPSPPGTRSTPLVTPLTSRCPASLHQ
jgi:hypothetical protein